MRRIFFSILLHLQEIMSSITFPGWTFFTNVKCKGLQTGFVTWTNNNQAIADTLAGVSLKCDFFEMGVIPYTTEGAFVFSTQFWYQRMGRVVHIYQPAMLDEVVSATLLRTPAAILPTYLRGSTFGGQQMPCVVISNLSASFGIWSVLGGGQMIWGVGPAAGNFTAGLTGGVGAQTYTYFVT